MFCSCRDPEYLCGMLTLALGDLIPSSGEHLHSFTTTHTCIYFKKIKCATVYILVNSQMMLLQLGELRDRTGI